MNLTLILPFVWPEYCEIGSDPLPIALTTYWRVFKSSTKENVKSKTPLSVIDEILRASLMSVGWFGLNLMKVLNLKLRREFPFYVFAGRLGKFFGKSLYSEARICGRSCRDRQGDGSWGTTR